MVHLALGSGAIGRPRRFDIQFGGGIDNMRLDDRMRNIALHTAEFMVRGVTCGMGSLDLDEVAYRLREKTTPRLPPPNNWTKNCYRVAIWAAHQYDFTKFQIPVN